MQKWEYLFVNCHSDRNTWKARYINNKEVKNWKSTVSAYDYVNLSGEEGWELVTCTTGPATLRFYFKRPIEE